MRILLFLKKKKQKNFYVLRASTGIVSGVLGEVYDSEPA
jgi:hypothetical protein